MLCFDKPFWSVQVSLIRWSNIPREKRKKKNDVHQFMYASKLQSSVGAQDEFFMLLMPGSFPTQVCLEVLEDVSSCL